MNVAHFITFCGKLEYSRSGCIFAYISMITQARDFKFAPVQRLQLALTQKIIFSALYLVFSWNVTYTKYGSNTRVCTCVTPTQRVYTGVGWKIQSTRRRPEVHTFAWKIAQCIAPMGVNDMRDL